MTTGNLRSLRSDPSAQDGRDRSIDAELLELEKLARLLLAKIEEIGRLRRAGNDPCDAGTDNPLVGIAYAAKIHGVSKEAVRKKAQRMGLAVRAGGRLKIHSSAVAALYPSKLSGLSKVPDTLTVRCER